MSNIVDVDPQRITLTMRARIEALSSAADMIEVLYEIASENVMSMQAHIEKIETARWGEWRVIYTMLNLIDTQATIIRDTVIEFETHDAKNLAA